MQQPNPVVWFEIYVGDLARAQRFYETVFQIQLTPLPTPEGGASEAGLRMLAFPSDENRYGAAGTLVQMPGVSPSSNAASSPGTVVYFACADCAVEQARAVEAGGRVHQAKFAIGPHGFCALVIDSEGNCIGLHSMQ